MSLRAIPWRFVMRWTLITASVALWCGVTAVGLGRAAEPPMSGLQQYYKGENSSETRASDGLQPVWVIVVYEVRRKRLIGITEFVFPSYEDCQNGAEAAMRSLELHLRPVCYLRWMRADKTKDKGK